MLELKIKADNFISLSAYFIELSVLWNPTQPDF